MLTTLLTELQAFHAKLVAVSKTKPAHQLAEMYEKGQRIFGENKVQELVLKAENLPKDIEWHFIGHLQRNKVKYIAPFIHTIHAVDSFRLLQEINKQAKKHNRNINCLLQFKIAKEETKFGLDQKTATDLLQSLNNTPLPHLNITGVMGMATFTHNEAQVRQEFQALKAIFTQLKQEWFADNAAFQDISMGMSGDYKIALSEGSTMVRVGSLLFGKRINKDL